MLRDPVGVVDGLDDGVLSGVSWWMTVSVPSAFDANASPDAGSKPAPSTPAPIGAVATTFPPGSRTPPSRRCGSR